MAARAPSHEAGGAPAHQPSTPSPGPPSAQPHTGRRSPAARVRPAERWPRLVRRELGPLARAGLSRPPASSVSRISGDIVDGVAEHHRVAAGP
jgi:hypothetical protein